MHRDVASSSSPLVQLEQSTGSAFPALSLIRKWTKCQLDSWSIESSAFFRDLPVSIALMGSWGRGEAMVGSDVDYVLLADGPVPSDIRTRCRPQLARLGPLPGHDEVFDRVVSPSELLSGVGMTDTGIAPLMTRVAFLLEAVGVPDSPAQRRVADLRSQLMAHYATQSSAAILIGELLRYWQVLVAALPVDLRAQPANRDLLIIKLRVLRKATVVAGALATVNMESKSPGAVHEPTALFDLTMCDRLAAIGLDTDTAQVAAQMLHAYEACLALFHAFRTETGQHPPDGEVVELATEFETAALEFVEAVAHRTPEVKALLGPFRELIAFVPNA